VQELATKWGWGQFDLQENIKMVSFTNGPDRINVYYSRMTVATIIDHPTKGRNTLYRKGVTFDMLSKIFANPREHLGIGYHRRAKTW
jgi:hypothetical protein